MTPLAVRVGQPPRKSLPCATTHSYETRHADNTTTICTNSLGHSCMRVAKRRWPHSHQRAAAGPQAERLRSGQAHLLRPHEQALYRKVPHCPWEVVNRVGASLGLVLTVWSTCRLRHDCRAFDRGQSGAHSKVHLDGRRIREAHSYHRLPCVISCSADVGRRLRLS